MTYRAAKSPKELNDAAIDPSFAGAIRCPVMRGMHGSVCSRVRPVLSYCTMARAARACFLRSLVRSRGMSRGGRRQIFIEPPRATAFLQAIDNIIGDAEAFVLSQPVVKPRHKFTGAD